MARNRERNLTVLGKETVFSGHMKFTDNLAVEGKFSGAIEGLGALTIEKTAVCEADFVHTHSVTVKGKLEANVSATDYVELVSGSKMKGNIVASRLKIADDVDFEGAVKMIRDNTTVDNDFFSLTAKDIKAQLGR